MNCRHEKPHVELIGDELGKHGSNKEYRDAIDKYFFKLDAKGKRVPPPPVTNSGSKRQIAITWQGVKHGMSKANIVELKLMAGLPQILKSADYRGRKSPTDKHAKRGVSWNHEYSATIKMGDETFVAGVVTHEKRSGDEYYNHAVITSKE